MITKLNILRMVGYGIFYHSQLIISCIILLSLLINQPLHSQSFFKIHEDDSLSFLITSAV